MSGALDGRRLRHHPRAGATEPSHVASAAPPWIPKGGAGGVSHAPRDEEPCGNSAQRRGLGLTTLQEPKVAGISQSRTANAVRAPAGVTPARPRSADEVDECRSMCGVAGLIDGRDYYPRDEAVMSTGVAQSGKGA
jgi:hypothetical protein